MEMSKIEKLLSNNPGAIMKTFISVFMCIIDSAFVSGYNEANVNANAESTLMWLELEKNKTQIQEIVKQEYYNDEQSFKMYKGLFLQKIRFLEAIFSFGAMFGSLSGLNASIKLGRKGGLLMTSFLSFTGALFSGYSKYFGSIVFLYVGRFFFGFKCGLNFVLAPLYILEIVPKSLKARYGVLFSLFITIGQLIGNRMNNILGNSKYWPLLYSISIFPSIILLIILPNCPESPKYLYIVKGNELKCKRALKWFRGNKFDENELLVIKQEFLQYFLTGDITLETILNNHIFKQALIITSVIMLSNRVCGISGVMHYYFNFYEEKIYFAYFTLIGSGIICMFLVEFISRKLQLFVTYTIMSIASLMICITLAIQILYSSSNFDKSTMIQTVINVSLILHMVGYQLGIGSLIWFLPSEYFATKIMPYAYVIGGFFYWFLSFIFIMFYIPMQDYMGYLSFINPYFSNLIIAYFVYKVVPDTNGKTLKEVYHSIFMYLKKKGELI